MAGAEGAAEATYDLACELVYRFFARAFNDPRAEAGGAALDDSSLSLTLGAANYLRTEFSGRGDALGFGELPAEELDLRPVLSFLRQPPGEREAEFARVFGLVSCRECPPYETEYNALEDTFYRSQQMADIAGFYRAFGLVPAADLGERADHLSLELEFSALLLTKKRLALAAGEGDRAAENAAICQEARTKFFRDHFGWWTPSFSVALRRKAASGIYDALGCALAAFLPIERTRLGVPASLAPLQASLIESPDECSGCDGDLVELKV